MSVNKKLASVYTNFFSALDLNKNFPHEQINSKPVAFDDDILFYMLNTSIGVANEIMDECKTHCARVWNISLKAIGWFTLILADSVFHDLTKVLKLYGFNPIIENK